MSRRGTWLNQSAAFEKEAQMTPGELEALNKEVTEELEKQKQWYHDPYVSVPMSLLPWFGRGTFRTFRGLPAAMFPKLHGIFTKGLAKSKLIPGRRTRLDADGNPVLRNEPKDMGRRAKTKDAPGKFPVDPKSTVRNPKPDTTARASTVHDTAAATAAAAAETMPLGLGRIPILGPLLNKFKQAHHLGKHGPSILETLFPTTHFQRGWHPQNIIRGGLNVMTQPLRMLTPKSLMAKLVVSSGNLMYMNGLEKLHPGFAEDAIKKELEEGAKLAEEERNRAADQFTAVTRENLDRERKALQEEWSDLAWASRMPGAIGFGGGALVGAGVGAGLSHRAKSEKAKKLAVKRGISLEEAEKIVDKGHSTLEDTLLYSGLGGLGGYLVGNAMHGGGSIDKMLNPLRYKGSNLFEPGNLTPEALKYWSNIYKSNSHISAQAAMAEDARSQMSMGLGFGGLLRKEPVQMLMHSPKRALGLIGDAGSELASDVGNWFKKLY